MAKINWPPKKCFKYAFREENELDFEIAFEEKATEKIKNGKINNEYTKE